MSHPSNPLPHLPAASQQLSTESKQYAEVSLSDNTKLAYKRDIVRFLDFGECPVPASAADVANYIARHGASHKPATLERWLISIGRYHSLKGWDNPCTDESVRTVLKGIRRQHGSKQRRVVPLLKHDLNNIVSQMTTTVRDMRDRALILLGFTGAFRRSEVAALTRDSISIRSGSVIVTLDQSKTNQEGELEQVGIARSSNPALCPIMALKEWLALNPREALFPGIDKHGHISYDPMCDRTVARIIKTRLRLAGIDATEYSGHSMRAGYATSAALAGVPIWRIRRQTRHAKLDQLDKYIREAELMTPDPIL